MKDLVYELGLAATTKTKIETDRGDYSYRDIFDAHEFAKLIVEECIQRAAKWENSATLQSIISQADYMRNPFIYEK